MNALHAHRSIFASKESLAQESCRLEIEKLAEPIRKQDRYAAAFGGLNFIEFHPNDSVTVQPVMLPQSLIAELEGNMMLFYTGDQRDARSLLSKQVAVMQSDSEKVAPIQRMVDLAY